MRVWFLEVFLTGLKVVKEAKRQNEDTKRMCFTAAMDHTGLKTAASTYPFVHEVHAPNLYTYCGKEGKTQIILLLHFSCISEGQALLLFRDTCSHNSKAKKDGLPKPNAPLREESVRGCCRRLICNICNFISRTLVMVTDSWPACHEFKPSATEDSRIDGRMHVESVKTQTSLGSVEVWRGGF
ncbi:hypothetical protein TNCV_766381 [Trichonephila clavipes]|nr:hypothetical protein TNCV_766381 [Trichonephila clavipes]